MNIKTISVISQIATLSLFSFNHLPLVTIKEVLIMVEMVDVADIAEEVHVLDEAEEGEGTEKVEEEEISKLTANRRFKAKVGMSKHSPLNLLSLLPSKILLHFLVLQLNSFQITLQTLFMNGEMNNFQINKIILK